MKNYCKSKNFHPFLREFETSHETDSNVFQIQFSKDGRFDISTYHNHHPKNAILTNQHFPAKILDFFKSKIKLKGTFLTDIEKHVHVMTVIKIIIDYIQLFYFQISFYGNFSEKGSFCEKTKNFLGQLEIWII